MIKRVDCTVVDSRRLSELIQGGAAGGESAQEARRTERGSAGGGAKYRDAGGRRGTFRPELLDEILEMMGEGTGQDKLNLLKRLARYFAFDIPPLGLIIDLLV